MLNLSTNLISSLNPQQKRELSELLEVYKYRWTLHAREKQLLPEGNWQTWLINAGRGFGKTRTGAETIRIWKDHYPSFHLVAETAADARDVMVEGKLSGILDISPKWDRPIYEPSKRRLTWNNGARAILFSGDDPDQLRGPQCHKAWIDELAKMRYAQDTWDNLQMGLRLGDNPQCIVTTTPRPIKIIKELINDPNTYITNGTSYENRNNLAENFFNYVIKKYEGTRLGRQELNAELLEDVEGALWQMSLIDRNRVTKRPDIRRIVIAVDPAVSANPDSDETGIIVAGITEDDECYILEDLSGIYTPNQWASKAIHAYTTFEADAIVAEVNQGGDLVEENILNIDNHVRILKIRAFKGKYLRAEPKVGLYERGKVHHVGAFPKLEEEMTTWDASAGMPSPNRLDALVYSIGALTDEQDGWSYVV